MNDKASYELAEKMIIAGDVDALEKLLHEHPDLRQRFSHSDGPQGSSPDTTEAARSIMVREHQFKDFGDFLRFREAISQEFSATARFEAAVDAVVNGDVQILRQWLHEDPGLIKARSVRVHGATLLHYVGANGVEGWRQKTPPNAVEIADILLTAGAEVDAEANLYGGGATTLGLAATSIYPFRAGVLEPLLDRLLQAGAKMGGPDLINSCLANGRRRAAEYLAEKGAPLDLEGAAGIGRLDLVKQYLSGHDPVSTDPKSKVNSAFAWACEYGRTDVAKFLLEAGVPIDTKVRNHFQTGLHWAAYGAHLDLVDLLLAKGAPVNLKDPTFNGTPLEWALYAWSEPSPDIPTDRFYAVAKRLTAAGSTVDPDWLSSRGIDSMFDNDPHMRAALNCAQ